MWYNSFCTMLSDFVPYIMEYNYSSTAACHQHIAIPTFSSDIFSVSPLPPTNLQSSGIGNRTVTLTWQAPVVTFLNSLTAVSSYQVTATQEQFANVSDIYVNIDAITTTYTFPQTLEEYTVYICTVKARNSFGLGSASHTVTFRTLQTGMHWHELLKCIMCQNFTSVSSCSSIITTTVGEWCCPEHHCPFVYLVTTTTNGHQWYHPVL